MEWIVNGMAILFVVWFIYFLSVPRKEIMYSCKYCKMRRPMHAYDCPRAKHNLPTREY